MKNLILLVSKKDDFGGNLPIYQKEVSNDKTNEEKDSFIRKMHNFRWILSKKHVKMAIFLGASRP